MHVVLRLSVLADEDGFKPAFLEQWRGYRATEVGKVSF